MKEQLLESYFDKNPGSENANLILFHVKLKFLGFPFPEDPQEPITMLTWD